MSDPRTLTIILSADPPGLDTLQLQGVQNWAEAVAVSAVYDQLLFLDSNNIVRPKIATSLRWVDGGRTWMLTLRPDVRFSDRTPFDAAAVQFNWARLAASEGSPAGRHAALIETMDVVDPLTLRVRLRSPLSRWDLLVTRYLSSIGSPTAIARDPKGFAEAPVGAGPFRLVEWTRGSRMTFVRNEDYWQPGKPQLDEIMVLTGIADAAPKFAAMHSGRAQVALEPMGENIVRYRAEPDRFTLLTTPDSGGGVALMMNSARAPFDDVRVRRALALTLDSAAFVEAAGYGDPDAVMTTIDRPGTFYHDPEIRLPNRNIAAAQALIDAVVAERDGPIAVVLETFANEGHRKEALAIKAILEAKLKNVAVEVAVGSVAELVAKWRSGAYQASNYAVQWSEPALDLPPHFGSASPLNFTHYRNDDVDAALARLTAAADPAQMIEAHHQVLRRLLEDVPLIWLSYKSAYHVVDRRVQGWELAYSLRPLLEEARLTGGDAEP
jgi:peptide/nickel transport system substrate-binding protein